MDGSQVFMMLKFLGSFHLNERMIKKENFKFSMWKYPAESHQRTKFKESIDGKPLPDSDDEEEMKPKPKPTVKELPLFKDPSLNKFLN